MKSADRGAAKQLGQRPTATWKEVESPKRWPIQSTTALISSR